MGLRVITLMLSAMLLPSLASIVSSIPTAAALHEDEQCTAGGCTLNALQHKASFKGGIVDSLSAANPEGVENDDDVLFRKYIDLYGKSYDGSEYEWRKSAFLNGLAAIEAQNGKAQKTWTAGVTRFTDHDVPTSGFSKRQWLKHQEQRPLALRQEKVGQGALPEAVDWRDKPGVITAVKNQGTCGGCWAFGATATVESYVAIEGYGENDLSVQQLIMCSPNEDECGGTGGCEGSIAQLAYEQIMNSTLGLQTEWEDPYLEFQTAGGTPPTGKCAPAEDPVEGFMISGYENLPTNDAEAVMRHLATKGPLTANVAVEDSWGLYTGGVFDGCTNMNSVVINHVVQLVGYGTENNTAYWLIRNSWGTGFGENGYMKLKRYYPNEPEPIAIDDDPLAGTGCAKGPNKANATQMVGGTCGILFDTSYVTGARALGRQFQVK